MFGQFWILFLGSFVACSGSAGGGIKMIRAVVLYKQVARELMRAMHPRAVYNVRFGASVIPDQVLHSILGFLFIYVVTIVSLTLLLMATELDVITAFSAVVACINNTGPGLGLVFFPGSGTKCAAGIGVPGRDPVPPPQLTRDAPGLDILHPGEKGLSPRLGDDVDAPAAHRHRAIFDVADAASLHREEMGVEEQEISRFGHGSTPGKPQARDTRRRINDRAPVRWQSRRGADRRRQRLVALRVGCPDASSTAAPRSGVCFLPRQSAAG